MQPFALVRPETVGEAVRILAGEEDAELLAGGQTLIPTMKQGLRRPAVLVSLARCRELVGIREQDGEIVIGAMTPHADVARSSLTRRILPGLAELAGLIGDPAVRSRGTIGGSIANADPAADYPAALLALEADIVTDRRHIPAGEFFRGLFETALEAGEIVTAVRFPAARRSAYAKFRHPASGYAVVGVFVAELANGEARVAVTGAAPTAFRWQEAEARLAGANWQPAALDDLSLDPAGLNSDPHADASYRAHLAAVMLRRTVETFA
ncbi:MAG: xanthine dehydrogenase family protein subunit M [Alphaproteobacteria bacterium]|nr:MAG: xanthine dehydrogenase family protein subunit M [Alphaproteobacteria bacterium]